MIRRKQKSPTRFVEQKMTRLISDELRERRLTHTDGRSEHIHEMVAIIYGGWGSNIKSLELTVGSDD